MDNLCKHTARIVASLVLCFVMLFSIMPVSHAAGMTASVATGPVTLNGKNIDNSSTKYPLLVYKDITYIPMTYHLCRFLGVKTEWDGKTSTLTISKTDERAPYSDNMYSGSISGNVTVTPVNYPVIVNGRSINNKNAKWPLVNYNSVTYFPLTWEYAVESFGWQYSWNAKTGLRIDSAKPAVKPDPVPDTGNSEFDRAVSALNSNYAKSQNYSGVLTTKGNRTSRAFQANVSIRNSGNVSIAEMTADPFVFFESGRSVWASYKNGLSSDPDFGLSGYGDRAQREKSSKAFNNTELGYLSRCFLDFQFSGNRISKISDKTKVEKDFGAVAWNMYVRYDSDGHTGYNAALTINSKGNVDNIMIETKEYILSMTPLD